MQIGGRRVKEQDLCRIVKRFLRTVFGHHALKVEARRRLTLPVLDRAETDLQIKRDRFFRLGKTAVHLRLLHQDRDLLGIRQLRIRFQEVVMAGDHLLKHFIFQITFRLKTEERGLNVERLFAHGFDRGDHLPDVRRALGAENLVDQLGSSIDPETLGVILVVHHIPEEFLEEGNIFLIAPVGIRDPDIRSSPQFDVFRIQSGVVFPCRTGTGFVFRIEQYPGIALGDMKFLVEVAIQSNDLIAQRLGLCHIFFLGGGFKLFRQGVCFFVCKRPFFFLCQRFGGSRFRCFLFVSRSGCFCDIAAACAEQDRAGKGDCGIFQKVFCFHVVIFPFSGHLPSILESVRMWRIISIRAA